LAGFAPFLLIGLGDVKLAVFGMNPFVGYIVGLGLFSTIAVAVVQVIFLIVAGIHFVRFLKSELTTLRKSLLLLICVPVFSLALGFAKNLVPEPKELRLESMTIEEMKEATANGENIFLPVD
jgi:predicted Abi (CAAX) family protease